MANNFQLGQTYGVNYLPGFIQYGNGRASASGLSPDMILQEKAGGMYEVIKNPNYTPGDAEMAAKLAAGRTPRYSDAGVPTGQSEIDAARASLFAGDRGPMDEAAKRKVREDVRAQFEEYLAAVNANFNNLLASKKQEGQARLGRTRAMASFGGTLGGSFGEQALRTTENFNTEVEAGVEAQRLAKIGEIEGNIASIASRQIELETAAREKRAENYLKSLETIQNEARTNMAALAGAGRTLDELKANPDLYEKTRAATGYDAFTFDSLYNASLPDWMKVQYQNFDIKLPNGNAGIVRIGLDPKTGKASQTQYDFGVAHETIKGKYPGGYKDVDGILYGIEQNGALVPLTKKTTSFKDMPASYQEWSLAGGEKGTGKKYADFVKDKGGKGFNPTNEEKSAVNRYLSTIGGTASDMQKAGEDPAFFYSVLQKAVEQSTNSSNGFNIQPFKNPLFFPSVGN